MEGRLDEVTSLVEINDRPMTYVYDWHAVDRCIAMLRVYSVPALRQKGCMCYAHGYMAVESQYAKSAI